MNIGDLNKRITIQKKDGSISDGGGGKIPNWIDEKTVWASVTPVDATEYVAAGLRDLKAGYVVVVRYYKGFDFKRRLKYGDKTLEVKDYVNKGEENRFYVITCKEVN